MKKFNPDTKSLNKIITINRFTEFKTKEKGSVFIGHAYPVTSEEQINIHLAEIRKKYFDATHHCYAYRLLENNFSHSDAGEPKGTAGIRIFNAIQHFGLENILIVIIRYFGGTKLGIGPLGKAYYNIALNTLATVKKIEKTYYSRLKIIFDYSSISKIHRLLNDYNAKEMTNLAEDFPAIIFLIPDGDVDKFQNELREISNGKLEAAVVSKSILL